LKKNFLRPKNKQTFSFIHIQIIVLHHSAYLGNAKLLRYFLEKGADYSIVTAHFLYTPLHWAVVNGHEKCVRYLIRKGAK